jgi:hypothetical protein
LAATEATKAEEQEIKLLASVYNPQQLLQKQLLQQWWWWQ